MKNLPTFPTLKPATDERLERALYYRRVLHELIEIGLDLARMTVRRAQAQADAAARGTATPGASVYDAAVAYESICSTVRRTILLSQKITEPLQAPAAARAALVHAAIPTEIRGAEDSIH